MVAIDYIYIPRGQSFMILSIYLVVMNTMVDSQTPYSCIIANLITETIRLKRHVHIGTVGAALGLSHFPTADTSCYMATTQLTLLSFSNSLVPAVSSEVTLTPELCQVTSGSL